MSHYLLNYRIAGNGPPLLLVHGFGISFNIWNELVPLLGPHFTLIMVELPGIGNSPRPEKEKTYLDQVADGIENIRILLKIERWKILSYSSGTRVAERYIQLNDSRVESAVFLCAVRFSKLRALSLSNALKFDHRFSKFGDWILSGSRLKFLIELLGFNLKKNNLSVEWFAEISSQPIEILKETLRSLLVPNAHSFKIPSDVPAFFIWGDEDLVVETPREHLSSDVVIHANHSAPETEPRQVADALLPFLLSDTLPR